jgi:hypothetical protein
MHCVLAENPPGPAQLYVKSPPGAHQEVLAPTHTLSAPLIAHTGLVGTLVNEKLQGSLHTPAKPSNTRTVYVPGVFAHTQMVFAVKPSGPDHCQSLPPTAHNR